MISMHNADEMNVLQMMIVGFSCGS